jgi:uncharacterized membrane protein
MSDSASQAGWWDNISHRAEERDRERQVLYNNVRKAVVHRNFIAHYVEEYVPALVAEFFKMLAGSLIGFWVIGKLLAYFFHANPLYTFSALGIIFSAQATYYKFRLARNPDFKIPRCKCSSRRTDSSEAVLKSSQSTILGIPNSVLGALFYIALIVMAYLKHTDAMMLVGVGAVAVSAYLSYGMVAKIRGLCVNCVNVAALNILILLRVLH